VPRPLFAYSFVVALCMSAKNGMS